MHSNIDIPLANGWHVTVFPPAFGLLAVAAAVLAVVAMTLWRARS